MTVSIDPRLRQVLPKLRKKHRDLYWIDINNTYGYEVKHLLVRPLTRREFMQVQQDVELGCDPTEIILSECIIWPEYDWENIITNKFYDLPCRVFDQLADCIVEVSGFASNEHIAETFVQARKAANSLDGMLAIVICKAFSSITPKMLDDMTMWDISRLFAMAETTLPETIDLRLFLDEEYAHRIMIKEQRKNHRRSRVNVPGAPGTFGRTDRHQQQEVPPVPQGWGVF